MSAERMSRREFCEFREDVSRRKRIPKRYGSGRAIKPRAHRPVSHARGWVVRMREPDVTRELGVTRELLKLTAEGIRNNIC